MNFTFTGNSTFKVQIGYHSHTLPLSTIDCFFAAEDEEEAPPH